MDLAERRAIVGNVLQDVVGHDQVIAVVGQGDVGQIELHVDAGVGDVGGDVGQSPLGQFADQWFGGKVKDLLAVELIDAVLG